MSDRFALYAPKEETDQFFGVTSGRQDLYEPDYNISPGRLIPAIYKEGGMRHIHNFQWGLIPEGAKTEEEGRPFFESPLEQLEEDSWLRECFKSRRCIIPANGFYKWKTSKKKQTPFYVRLLSERLMAIAGIYSVWKSPRGRDVYSCSMLTTKANILVQPVDERMPAAVRREYFAEWLNKEPLDKQQLSTILKPYQLTEMAVNRVTDEVGDKSNNGPELIQPIPK